MDENNPEAPFFIYHDQPAFTDILSSSFMQVVASLRLCAMGDPWFSERHLLFVMTFDLYEMATTISLMTQHRLLSNVRRELRFLIEASLKIAFIQQQDPDSSLDAKLVLFESLLNDPSISLKKRLNLSLLPHEERRPFLDEVGRLYGETSKYVHLTTDLIIERVNWLEKLQTGASTAPFVIGEGGSLDFDSLERAVEFHSLNTLVERALTCATILLFHSVPVWVVYDVLERLNDSRWFPLSSPLIKEVSKTVVALVKQNQVPPRR